MMYIIFVFYVYVQLYILFIRHESIESDWLHIGTSNHNQSFLYGLSWQNWHLVLIINLYTNRNNNNNINTRRLVVYIVVCVGFGHAVLAMEN